MFIDDYIDTAKSWFSPASQGSGLGGAIKKATSSVQGAADSILPPGMPMEVFDGGDGGPEGGYAPMMDPSFIPLDGSAGMQEDELPLGLIDPMAALFASGHYAD
jgi:hypothetical protein